MFFPFLNLQREQTAAAGYVERPQRTEDQIGLVTEPLGAEG